MEPNFEILIDYLDQQLSPDTSSGVEKMVLENKEAAADLLYLKLAVDAVRQDVIRQRVSQILEASVTKQQTEKQKHGIVRNLYRTSFRVAAVIILLAGIVALYKFISVNSQSLYEKQYSDYELSNSRGQEKTDDLSRAYQNKNWNAVLALYQNEAVHSNKSTFLAGMAEIQEKHFPQAVNILENSIEADTRTSDSSFRDETEYYLSLAYLMDHKVNKSIALMDKIKADPSHPYYPIVSRISYIDLKIIELKK
jgi:hypothetical protein